MSESRAIGSSVPVLRLKLTQTAADVRRTTFSTGCYELCSRWLVIVATLFVLDLLFALPVWLRWATLLGQLGFLAWA